DDMALVDLPARHPVIESCRGRHGLFLTIGEQRHSDRKQDPERENYQSDSPITNGKEAQRPKQRDESGECESESQVNEIGVEQFRAERYNQETRSDDDKRNG